MKTIQSIISFAAVVILFAAISCSKEPIQASTPSPFPVTPIAPVAPVAPVANAGADIKIEIPKTSIVLPGSATDADNNIKNYSWKKISGPESYFLEWGNQLLPKLIWMEEGEYEFELMVTDNDLLFDKDTVKVTVFSNLKKHVINDLTPDGSGFSTVQIPLEVANNIRWVFAKCGGRCEQADAGPNPGMDYNWGGYYFTLLAGNIISVFGGYSNDPTVDITIYY